MIPLIPVAVIGLGVTAAYKVYKKRNQGMTPERRKVYESALNTLKDPEKLRVLGAAFKREGLTEEATMLNKRAKLRELPPDVKAGRRDAFKKGMTLKNPINIEKLAVTFEKEGATGAAAALRKYAGGLPRKIG
jgi:hypothetical protein